MASTIDIGKVSARGQIAIPAQIRRQMNLQEGDQVFFYLHEGSLVLKKVTDSTFAEIVKPLQKAATKSGFKESEVEGIIQRFRTQRRR